MFQNYFSLFQIGLINPLLVPQILNIKLNKKTYLGYPQILSLIKNFSLLKNKQQNPLQIAEFGVGRGGSAILLSWLVSKYGGHLFLYDVFGQIPSPTDLDGIQAKERYNFIIDQENNDYYGNIPNLIKLIQSEIGEVCDLNHVSFIVGKYEDTLNVKSNDHEFDLIHIDCDWYESSKSVLNYLKRNINSGAIIQIDDYSNWQGSNNAVNEAEWLKPYRRWLVNGSLVIDTGSPLI